MIHGKYTFTRLYDANEIGMRLERFMTDRLKVSFPLAQKLFRKKRIFITRSSVYHRDKNTCIQENDTLHIRDTRLCQSSSIQRYLSDRTPTNSSISIKDRIIYQDDSLLVIDKPAGVPMDSSGSRPTDSFTVMDMMRSIRHPDTNETPRPCHRLDRGTSGVLLCPKTREASWDYYRLFETQSKQSDPVMHKIYLALVDLSRHPIPIQRNGSIHTQDGMITHYHYVSTHPSRPIACVVLEPKTGKYHQLRLHCSTVLQTPILGDTRYGSSSVTKEILLHCYQIHLIHQRMHFQAPIPPSFFAIWPSLLSVLCINKGVY